MIWCWNGLPSSSTVGITGRTRSGSTSAVAASSATLVTIFTPTQSPETRESMKPCRPRSRISWTLPGKIVNASEEQVRDLFAKLRQEAFEQALQMRVDAAEAAFPPSEGCGDAKDHEE